jgi:Na+/H+ antiporter
MLLLELVLLLMICAVALGWLARHFKFPYPIALVVGGALLGLIPRLPQFPFDPQLILVVVLPPILYQAALLTSWSDFKTHIRSISLLAIGLVIVTTLAVGITLKLMVPSVPWAAAFVLGAIVSPPDAVAATTILSRLNIPRHLVTILEGESLVNDASGLVIYKLAIVAVLTGAFSMGEATAQFALVSVGGVLIGIVLGFVFVEMHKRLGDPFIEVITALAIPYIGYIAAESLHVSGVLAVVAAGLVRGRYAPEIVSAEMRIMARSVWNVLVFMLNSLVFILIGIQMSDVMDTLGRYPLSQLVLMGTAISLVAVVVRFAWVYPAAYLPRWFPALVNKQVPQLRRRELGIISWCGMRGIVSLAAALALPATLPGGEPFPGARPDHLPHLLRHRRHAGRAGPDPGAADPQTQGGQRLEHGRRTAAGAQAMSAAAIAAVDAHLAQRGRTAEWGAMLRAEIAERVAWPRRKASNPTRASAAEGTAPRRHRRRAPPN